MPSTSASVFALLCLLSATTAQTPLFPQTYALNRSTVVMPCSSGAPLAASFARYGLVQIDWSDQKSVWAAAKPMNCDSLLSAQADALVGDGAARVGVYVNSIKALPWFAPIREKLSDPRFAPWFISFSNGTGGTYHVPPCDANYKPPLCSALYHDQAQTPEFPHGDGDCSAPACDVGGVVPVGEYVFNHLSANLSIGGQTMLDWFIDDVVFSATAGNNSNVSFFFFDDQMEVKGPTEMDGHFLNDTGINATTALALTVAYWDFMDRVYDALVERGKFSWQQLLTEPQQEYPPWRSIGSTCPGPFIGPGGSCATKLRGYCNASSVTQTRAIMYAWTPGGCGHTKPGNLTTPLADIVNFQLIRGPYAWLGFGWQGCDVTDFQWPQELDIDFGEPLGLCAETAPGSGTFTREFEKATVQMSCETYEPTIRIK